MVRARTENPPPGSLSPLLARLRNEYDEMPGLCLTQPQAERLCGLDRDACLAALTTLVETGYLRPTPRGYIRA